MISRESLPGELRNQEYINSHLFDDLGSDELSQKVGMSKYHFRRIFKTVCGENIGRYVQRLRLEYIAFKLITTNLSVSELLSQLDYQNKHSFSRAFKNYFNCSVVEFRKIHAQADPEGKCPVRLEPCVKKIPGVRIAYLKLEKTNNVKYDFTMLWKQLLKFSEDYKLSARGSKYVSLTLDYPFVTSELQSRFMIGVTIPSSLDVPRGFGVYAIASGEYALFHFKGLYHELNRVYRHIYLDWLPSSVYALREPFTFEVYLNTPKKTPVSELMTDIYIPVSLKEK